MRHKAFFILILLAAPFLMAQKPNVSDCIINANGDCRGIGIRQVSATNAANTVTLNAPNLVQTLAVTSTCSAGTAAITVSGAVDGANSANFIALDTVTAAATATKQYLVGTLGGTVMLSPLSFQFIRVSVATCGAGNTSTLIVAMKGL